MKNIFIISLVIASMSDIGLAQTRAVRKGSDKDKVADTQKFDESVYSKEYLSNVKQEEGADKNRRAEYDKEHAKYLRWLDRQRRSK